MRSLKWAMLITCAFLSLEISPSAIHATPIDFDNLSPGTQVTTIGTATFSSNIGLDLIVSTGFDTTSGLNYLGVDDGGFEVFFPGDIVTLVFSQLQAAFSLNVISSPFTPAGAFNIEALASSLVVGSQTSGAVPSTILPDGGEVFPITLAPSALFDEIRLSTTTFGLFSYNIDNVVAVPVPEPSTLSLFCVALALLGLTQWRRHTVQTTKHN